jgi:alkylation response protein AidB-like acyl-CoA dehydrogenase
MRFDFTDEQKAVRQTARDMLNRRFPSTVVRTLCERNDYDPAHWSEMITLGWPGLAVEERHGGLGMGMVGLVVLLEEMGRALAPSPFLSNAAATLVLQAAGDEQQRERWLPRVVSGEARLGFAIEGDNGRVLGIDVEGADATVIVAPLRGSALLAPHVGGSPVETIDRARRYSHLRDMAGDPLPGDVARGLDLVEVAFAAEMVGVGQRALEMAVVHAQTRVQFGKLIGTYQAVAHRCTEIFRAVESARSATYNAAWAADASPQALPLAASVAKASAADGSWKATADSLQVHGGIGFTWEHDLHLYLKRAVVDGRLLGSASQHYRRVAELSGLGVATPVAAGVGV